MKHEKVTMTCPAGVDPFDAVDRLRKAEGVVRCHVIDAISLYLVYNPADTFLPALQAILSGRLPLGAEIGREVRKGKGRNPSTPGRAFAAKRTLTAIKGGKA